MINFCRTFDYIILNGRSVGDPFGNYTHLNFNNGPSTIDYAICNAECHQLISNFLVLPMTEISDHSKIMTIFKESLPTNHEEKIDNYNWKKRKILYKWDKQRKQFFFNHLRNSEKEIEEINQRTDTNPT